MRVMLYCQHVLGIGHFFRSMEIARAFHRHQVLFVEGGEPLAGLRVPDHVSRAFLAPLRMDPQFLHLEADRGVVEAIQHQRREQLHDLYLGFQPDALIVELYPFGRKRFGSEILPLLEHIREHAPRTLVVCSLRDILVEKQDQAAYEERVLKILNRYFNLLLIHSDPRVVALAETFSRLADIRIPVEYTGFVGRPANRPPDSLPGKRIVASSGGGRVGIELLAAAIGAVRRLPDPDLGMRVFIGPFMEQGDREFLSELARNDSRVTLLPFSLDFGSELAAADLSISMAGYNTCMDIVCTGVRALVHPFRQNREQTLRAERLQSLGLLRILDNLDDVTLAEDIQAALHNLPTKPRLVPDVRGAAKSAMLVESLAGSH
ncbi:MAG TPA: glycosyl transferase [Syntrophobacteraceae bacterium]|nr:glycosyl transferase [Syntrophobacteraceae bacterium]